MRTLAQDQWLGIAFSELEGHDATRPADISFYNDFYKRLFSRCHSFEDLPRSWRRLKDPVAGFLMEHTEPGDRIVSIGAGIGYIETRLARAGRSVVVIEPAHEATRLLREEPGIRLVHDHFPAGVVGTEGPWALAIMVATEYVFDDDALIAILRASKDAEIGRFFLASVTTYRPWSLRELWALKAHHIINRIRRRKPAQSWGYTRTRREIRRLFAKAGFVVEAAGQIGVHSWWLARPLVDVQRARQGRGNHRRGEAT